MSNKKQLIIFLVICLPITWILGGIANSLNDGDVVTPMSNAISMLSCFIPAIAAVICCLVSKEGLKSLNITPKFDKNIKIYAVTIVTALVISVLDVPFIMCVFFPNIAKLNTEISISVMVFQVLLSVAVGCVQFFILMGEEIGWMGFLFPKLEKVCGMNLALVFTGIIRGLWHMVMLMGNEEFARNLLTLIITNIIGGCLLVLLTKKSGSVVPASIFHALNNTLPSVFYSFIIVDAIAYEKQENLITIVSYIPYIIVMIVCWFRLKKEKNK